LGVGVGVGVGVSVGFGLSVGVGVGIRVRLIKWCVVTAANRSTPLKRPILSSHVCRAWMLASPLSQKSPISLQKSPISLQKSPISLQRSLSGMDAGISTTGLCVTGVPIGNDEWVQQFVQ